jgi:hypothetical protein
MWYDARDAQCRGSLVGLTPNTTYQVELNLPGQAAARGLTFSTWANQRPVAKTIAVNSGSGTFNITEGGSPSGYVVYEGSGATLDGQNTAQYNVTVNASYVILRGLTLKGAKQDAIRVSPTVTDVIIEDNDISGWGRQRSGNWGVDMDSAIRAVCTEPTMQRMTVQRNKIHDPRYSANSWSDGHPAGPQAITVSYCGGNHVIRHNDMYSSNGNYFNDIIGGEDNFTKSGFPNADTDIYGNKLSHGWDDGIEAEGANENVRIWGNYIDRTAIGIATTVTSVGPVYIFRNVWNRAQMYEKLASLDSTTASRTSSRARTRRSATAGATSSTTRCCRRPPRALSYGLGGGFGMGGTGSAQLINNTFSKNNIYHLWKPGKSAFYQTGSGNDIANDLYNGTMGDASIVNGINGTPVYAAGHGWQSEAGGNYQLASTSPGFGRGVRIPNFNDGAATPDVGAHQSGTAAMRFGVAASDGSATSGGGTVPAASAHAAGSYRQLHAFGRGDRRRATARARSPRRPRRSIAARPAARRSSPARWSRSSRRRLPARPSTAGRAPAAAPAAARSPVGAAKTVTRPSRRAAAPPPRLPRYRGVTVSASSLGNFATSRTQTVTYTNKHVRPVTFLQASMSSTRYGQTNNCGDVAVGASCTATITYYRPTAARTPAPSPSPAARPTARTW